MINFSAPLRLCASARERKFRTHEFRIRPLERVEMQVIRLLQFGVYHRAIFRIEDTVLTRHLVFIIAH